MTAPTRRPSLAASSGPAAAPARGGPAEKHLPIEEHFRLNLERFIEMKMPHAAGKVHVEIEHPPPNTAAVSADETPKLASGTKIKKILLQFGR